jgi:uncharacterized protein YegP (UPF0339 family)
MKTYLAFPLLGLALSLSACGAVDDDLYADDGSAIDGKDDSVRTGRFETFTGRDGRFYFHLLAGNGQKVLQSQGYATEQSAATGIASVVENGQYADPYHILQAQSGEWYFNLYAGNWQVIATSEMYSSQSAAQKAVNTVIAIVQSSPTVPAASGARFQVFKGLDLNYHFHLRAANGEIVLQSQAYTTRTSAISGTSSVKTNGIDARRFTVKDAVNGQAYFVLTAANGQVIGVSETYVSRSNADHAAQAVSALIQTGTVADAH